GTAGTTGCIETGRGHRAFQKAMTSHSGFCAGISVCRKSHTWTELSRERRPAPFSPASSHYPEFRARGHDTAALRKRAFRPSQVPGGGGSDVENSLGGNEDCDGNARGLTRPDGPPQV